ncbi:hypothetical protein D3C87_666130 [compost metagenome]
MFGFDVRDDKYKFDPEWNYFSAHLEISPADYGNQYSDLEIEFNMNDAVYQLKKSYYQKQKKLYYKDFNHSGLAINDIPRLECLRKLTVEDLEMNSTFEYLEERLQKKIAGVFDELNTAALPFDNGLFGGGNLVQKPYKSDGKLMDYIGCIEDYDFQKTAADQLYLFYDKNFKKAVIYLEYT